MIYKINKFVKSAILLILLIKMVNVNKLILLLLIVKHMNLKIYVFNVNKDLHLVEINPVVSL